MTLSYLSCLLFIYISLSWITVLNCLSTTSSKVNLQIHIDNLISSYKINEPNNIVDDDKDRLKTLTESFDILKAQSLLSLWSSTNIEPSKVRNVVYYCHLSIIITIIIIIIIFITIIIMFTHYCMINNNVGISKRVVTIITTIL